MSEPIELITSTANWITYSTIKRTNSRCCNFPDENKFNRFHDAICYGTPCEQCPHWTKRNTTEIVNVLYRPLK